MIQINYEGLVKTQNMLNILPAVYIVFLPYEVLVKTQNMLNILPAVYIVCLP